MDQFVVLPAWALTAMVFFAVTLLSVVGFFVKRTLDRVESTLHKLNNTVQQLNIEGAVQGRDMRAFERRLELLEGHTNGTL
jgi:uncharacterized protein YoxC